MNAAVSVRIAGGLGNQMFQYAAARTLAQRLAVPLVLDLGFYDRARHRSYGLAAFALAQHGRIEAPAGGKAARWAAHWRRAVAAAFVRTPTQQYREPHLHYDRSIEALRAPVHLVGQFQSERYFAACGAALAKELAPPQPGDALSLRLAQDMAAQGEACALHIRRGDYLSNPKNRELFAECGRAYHEAALALLPRTAVVYVFSDEPQWAWTHVCSLWPEQQVVLVHEDAGRSVLADLWLMAQARHHIIANSSLSWWAAWLAEASTLRPAEAEAADADAAPAAAAAAAPQPPASPGLKLAPKQWFLDPAIDDRDLVPARWQRL